MDSDNQRDNNHQLDDTQRDDTCVDQLYQLFQSCDTSGNGLLGSDELLELLQLLQLDDQQTDFIITNLIGNDLFAKVNFSDFKETFVQLLTKSQSNYEEFLMSSSKTNRSINSLSNSSDLSPMQEDLNELPSTNLCDCNTEEYLRSIWNYLGVGQNGYLDMQDLFRVCEHIGMVGINDEIIQQLFEKLDHDQDGKVSFDEFLEGLFQHGAGVGGSSVEEANANFMKNQEPQEVAASNNKTAANNNQHQPNDNQDLLMEHKTFCSSNVNAYLIPMDDRQQRKVGYNPRVKINIQELIAQLEESLCSTNKFNTEFFQVALATFQHEYTQLRINYEQVKVERDKLRLNIAEANARVDLMVQEVDEHHAKIEETSQNKLNLLEKKYQDHIRSLEDELRKMREAQATQSFHLEQNIIKELSTAQEQETRLRDRIAALEQENKRLEKEIQVLNEKGWEAQELCSSLQKQMEDVESVKKKLAELESMHGFLRDQEQHSLRQENETLKLNNKELQDHNDELLLELETMRQKMVLRSVKRNKKSERRSEQNRLSDYIDSDKSAISNNSLAIRAVKRRGNGTSSDENSEEDSSISERSKRIVLSAKIHTRMEVDGLTDVPMEPLQESMSQTVSEGELLREIDALKDQLTKEIKRRDQLIDDRERTEVEMRENYEQMILDGERRAKELSIINNRLKFDIKETKRKIITDVKNLEDLMNRNLDGVLLAFDSQIKHNQRTSIQNLVQQTKAEFLQILCSITTWLNQEQQSDMDEEKREGKQRNGLTRLIIDVFADDEDGSGRQLLNDWESNDETSERITHFEEIIEKLNDENADLNKTIRLNEERLKEVEKENSRLLYKCKVLSKLLSEISR